MRVTLLLTTLLALALFVAGCGGPKDSDEQLAAACDRQIKEIEDAEEESDTPTAPSTQERLDETTLVECAGQEVTLAAAGDEKADTAAEEGDAVKQESDTAKDEEAEEVKDEAPAKEEPAELDPAARELFSTTCGGCHTLSDAGTSGAVGPNLDDSKPSADLVADRVENGAGTMPGGLLSGDDLDAVATYVSAAAGT